MMINPVPFTKLEFCLQRNFTLAPVLRVQYPWPAACLFELAGVCGYTQTQTHIHTHTYTHKYSHTNDL